MRNITKIFVHCSAGYGSIDTMKAWWRKLGWKVDGYHYVVDLEGKEIPLVPEDKISNGVGGYNSNSIHVCYIGGVERNNVSKAIDSRTPEQKKTLIEILTRLKRKYPNAQILGHRDISPDKNLNGIIDPWERIKECPSFDAIPEYKNIK